MIFKKTLLSHIFLIHDAAASFMISTCCNLLLFLTQYWSPSKSPKSYLRPIHLAIQSPVTAITAPNRTNHFSKVLGILDVLLS